MTYQQIQDYQDKSDLTPADVSKLRTEYKKYRDSLFCLRGAKLTEAQWKFEQIKHLLSKVAK